MKTLTPLLHAVINWFYEHQDWQHIDQGNIASAVIEYGGNNQNFIKFMKELLATGYVTAEDPPMNCFYHITDAGKSYLEKQSQKDE